MIRAFNEDMPYDQFLLEQLAADRLPGNTDQRNLAALGFLTVGRQNNRDTVHDIIDDWIDVVARGTQALTVSCARCHDHKFDPISTQDYYALHGIFQNTRRRDVMPLLSEGSRTEQLQAYEDALRARADALLRFQKERLAQITAGFRTPAQIAAYLLVAEKARHLTPAQIENVSRERNLNPLVLLRWCGFLNQAGANGGPLPARWQTLATLSPEEFKNEAAPWRNGGPAARRRRFAHAACRSAPGNASAGPAGPDAPPDVSLADFDAVRTADDQGTVETTNLALAALWARYADAGGPKRAMAVEDASEAQPSFVFVRGNPNNRGEEVPRRFLTLLAGKQPPIFTDGSGRLEMAKAIASSDNPLTARVFVNRVWQHHFGVGLVRTPSDFGTRGDPPSHPELLDYLAHRFVDGGWSIKNLHRLILFSRVYQQASDDHPANRTIDPDNRLLWRMNRRRLDFEALRDTLLTVAGQLDGEMGGPPLPLFSQPAMRRRTVYGAIDRAQVPVALRAFDFANPDQHTPQRHLTTVPQQALFLMNSPFPTEQARHLARRPEVAARRTPAEQIQALYRLALGRTPGADELQLALHFLEEGNASPPARERPEPAQSPWRYGFGEYDEAKQQLVAFQPFSVFVSADQQFASLFQVFPAFNEIWQTGHRLPDPLAGMAHLTATGGEPGAGPRHAVVRRWAAPADATVRITGSLTHKIGPEYGCRHPGLDRFEPTPTIGRLVAPQQEHRDRASRGEGAGG